MLILSIASIFIQKSLGSSFQDTTSIFDPKTMSNSTQILEICSMPFTSNDIYSGVMNTLYGIQKRMYDSNCPGSIDLSSFNNFNSSTLFDTNVNTYNMSSLENSSPLANVTMSQMNDLTNSMFNDALSCQVNMTRVMILVSSNMKLITNRLMCGQLQRDILLNREGETSTSFNCPYYRHNSLSSIDTYFPRGSLKDMARSLSKANETMTSDDDFGQVIIS